MCFIMYLWNSINALWAFSNTLALNICSVTFIKLGIFRCVRQDPCHRSLAGVTRKGATVTYGGQGRKEVSIGAIGVRCSHSNWFSWGWGWSDPDQVTFELRLWSIIRVVQWTREKGISSRKSGLNRVMGAWENMVLMGVWWPEINLAQPNVGLRVRHRWSQRRSNSRFSTHFLY